MSLCEKVGCWMKDFCREQAGERAAVRMSQQMRARLDTPSKSSFMYAPTPLSPPPLQGHRIVVSNLHPSVTHEDIKVLNVLLAVLGGWPG